MAKLHSERRFRPFLCKHTKADITSIIAQYQGHLGPQTLARAYGLGFGRDAIGRILLHKFVTQVKYLEKRIN